MHEQSETTKDSSGRWINVYGRKTKKRGQPLPRIYDWESDSYSTMEEASAAAKRRSEQFGREQMTPGTPF